MGAISLISGRPPQKGIAYHNGDGQPEARRDRDSLLVDDDLAILLPDFIGLREPFRLYL
jgi:hypothetical protein